MCSADVKKSEEYKRAEQWILSVIGQPSGSIANPRKLRPRFAALLSRLNEAELKDFGHNYCYLIPKSCHGVVLLRDLLESSCRLNRRWYHEMLSLIGNHARLCKSDVCAQECVTTALAVLPLPPSAQQYAWEGLCVNCLSPEIRSSLDHIHTLFNALSGLALPIKPMFGWPAS